MEEKKDIKEMKEMMVGLMEMALLLAGEFKDGVQLDDFMDIFMKLKDDPRFMEAFKGLKEIPAEAKDLDLNEGMELAMLVMAYVPKLIEAMKKK